MHVVLANQWFLPEFSGGVGKYNVIVAHAYRALGHQVSVIAKQPSPEVPLQENIDGIRVRRIPIGDSYYLRRTPLFGRYLRPMRQLLHAWHVNKALGDLHRLQPVDVVEFAEVNAEGYFYAREPLTQFVVRCHTPTAVLRRSYEPGELDFDTSIIERCERALVRRAHAVTAPSKDTARMVSTACGVTYDSIKVIPNPLPIPESTFEHSNGKAFECPVTILYVGRLERVKGPQVLAEAIPLVLKEVPEARFVFVGGDRPAIRGNSQSASLEGRLEQTNAVSNVQFLGSVNEAVLAGSYRAADICVVPSMIYESFSYTCAQAMAAGKPVVASRIGGIPETVEDGVTGILVAPGDAAELAQAIVRLAKDPDQRERMGRAGRDRVAKEFDPVMIAQQNLKVYEHASRQFRHPGAKA